MKKPIIIQGDGKNTKRPASHPPKSNWKISLLRKALPLMQHVSASQVARIIWKYFTRPGKARFSEAQVAIVQQATTSTIRYKGHQIATYRWGTEGPKVLLCHGWRSKAADFRRMIAVLIEQGYVVEGIDMKAHGNSDGEYTALPEFIDIFIEYYVKNGPYHTVVGYSMGGITAGITLSEITADIHPEHLILIAFPPYVRYFFYDIVKDTGCNEQVYHCFCDLVEKHYHQSVDYYDLREKLPQLTQSDIHLIYDEDDQTIPITKGEELGERLTDATFVRTQKMGHYQVIANEKVIDYITEAINQVKEEVKKGVTA